MDLRDVIRHNKMVHISSISRTTCHVIAQRVCLEGTIIQEAPASGFFWKFSGKTFLITNRHVFSGVHAFSGKVMGFCPNVLRLHFFAERPHDSGAFEMVRVECSVEILDGDEHPLWFEHPEGRTFDVACLPIEGKIGGGLLIPCLNATGMVEGGKHYIGDDVFIVGYPEAHSFDRGMPLWKRGSIATEPDLNQNNLPQIYVDTIGNKGLSGSPAFTRVDMFERPLKRSSENEAELYRFLGVYAGRVSDDGLGAQVGRIYKPECLQIVLEHACKEK